MDSVPLWLFYIHVLPTDTKSLYRKSELLRYDLYKFDPVKPNFYIVKLGFRGINILFFLFLLKNIGSGYSLGASARRF